MEAVLAVLYATSCTLLLLGAGFVYNRRKHSHLHRDFAAGCLFVVCWLATLYIFERLTAPSTLLLIGRLNFASVLFVSLLTWEFVRDLTNTPPRRRFIAQALTTGFAALTVFTPIVDRREQVVSGQHITTFGPVFPLYIAFVVAFLGAAVWHAVVAMRSADDRLRDQLAVIALGIFISSAITTTTNLILPYVYGVFGFQEVGALSILAFIAASGYAITVRRLFDVRLVIRKALVVAVLVAFVEQVYSESITHLVDRIPDGQGSALAKEFISYVTVLTIAVTFYPLRRWLEKTLDRRLPWKSSKRRAAR